MKQNIRKHSAGELAFFSAFDAQKTSFPGLVNNRQSAIAWLQQNGIATKRVDAYHYSDLRRQFAKSQAYTLDTTTESTAQVSLNDINAHPTIAAFTDLDYEAIIFVDGALRLDLSTAKNLQSTAQEKSTWVAENLAREVNENNVDNLTRAMWRDGVSLNIVENTQKPLHLIFGSSGDAATFNRHYIHVAAGVTATIIESHINFGDEASFNCHHFNLKLSQGAKLTHFATNGENHQATNICRTEGDFADDVVLETTTLAIGGGWVRREGDLYCNGSNMNLKISGAVLAGGAQHIDNTFILHHKLPQNISLQRFKNVVDDKAHAIFQGKVIVSPDAQQTDGQQMVHTILLSDHAEISTKPELEIYADDVECAHGATVGALDADMLFYLRARGIPLKQAQKMLIHAFIADIAAEMPEALNAAADQLVTTWLDQHLEV